ncbi:hypothetical protein NHQ30_002603 [Ciborinia camelliae]|nr:hypothetical protein NHQ30_002603 [Ciborinia camelliae]
MSGLQDNQPVTSAIHQAVNGSGTEIEIDRQLMDNKMTLPELAVRVHSACKEHAQKKPLEVLWTRKAIQNTPIANHIATIKKELYGSGNQDGGERTGIFTPKLGLTRVLNETAWNEPFRAHSTELVEMASNAVDLLQEIIEQQAEPSALPEKNKLGRRVWTQPVVIIKDDASDLMIQKARAGANGNRSTKSKVVPCLSPVYADVMSDFGLAGVAAYPVFLASWWMSLLMHDLDDWRQDYICTLGYTFYLEYNVDKANVQQFVTPLGKEVAAIWDMPDLPDELLVRRSHMLFSMSFFDLKRTHEAGFSHQMSDGLTVWVHKDRDTWRDFKALDAAVFGHYLSFATGVAGRDDLMLCGLVNDWIDLGPDLRYQECSQSVFALTRGSLAMTDLVKCYERTVWMLNASFTSEERHVGCMTTVGACIWELCNHRHDVWRYYSLAFDTCSALQESDLYKIANLADCYTPDLTPSTLADANVVFVPRRSYSYQVLIDHTEYKGSVMLHTTVCDAVESGILPSTVVDYQIILPLLLRNGEIDAATFLNYMDLHYCAHFADIMRSGHADGFSHAYGCAIAALVMEEWWSGLYFAIGIGSLIEAQPDHIANDRPH